MIIKHIPLYLRRLLGKKCTLKETGKCLCFNATDCEPANYGKNKMTDIDDEMKQKIDDLVGQAYEIGHLHGGNTFRLAQGKPPLGATKGWEPIANELFKLWEKTK